MSNDNIVRAWKGPSNRGTLVPEQQRALPAYATETKALTKEEQRCVNGGSVLRSTQVQPQAQWYDLIRYWAFVANTGYPDLDP